ncbi:unnamed protein product [Caenorhabditis bovis]|uniref:Uncharacterized protein n=1 Tax=Caenorhabditis bovis TaxID=2654633 RepID=A0A8S1F983_9PELO|nr:unnamed protein product [Caenorhabditis bovis]
MVMTSRLHLALCLLVPVSQPTWGIRFGTRSNASKPMSGRPMEGAFFGYGSSVSSRISSVSPTSRISKVGERRSPLWQKRYRTHRTSLFNRLPSSNRQIANREESLRRQRISPNAASRQNHASEERSNWQAASEPSLPPLEPSSPLEPSWYMAFRSGPLEPSFYSPRSLSNAVPRQNQSRLPTASASSNWRAASELPLPKLEPSGPLTPSWYMAFRSGPLEPSFYAQNGPTASFGSTRKAPRKVQTVPSVGVDIGDVDNNLLNVPEIQGQQEQHSVQTTNKIESVKRQKTFPSSVPCQNRTNGTSKASVSSGLQAASEPQLPILEPSGPLEPSWYMAFRSGPLEPSFYEKRVFSNAVPRQDHANEASASNNFQVPSEHPMPTLKRSGPREPSWYMAFKSGPIEPSFCAHIDALASIDDANDVEMENLSTEEETD